MSNTQFSMRQLLEAGVHFGHHPRRWNPKMSQYIFGTKGGVHIIDLQQTYPMLKKALDVLTDVVAQGGRVLFVGTKTQATEIVAEAAKRCGVSLRTFQRAEVGDCVDPYARRGIERSLGAVW